MLALKHATNEQLLNRLYDRLYTANGSEVFRLGALLKQCLTEFPEATIKTKFNKESEKKFSDMKKKLDDYEAKWTYTKSAKVNL